MLAKKKKKKETYTHTHTIPSRFYIRSSSLSLALSLSLSHSFFLFVARPGEVVSFTFCQSTQESFSSRSVVLSYLVNRSRVVFHVFFPLKSLSGLLIDYVAGCKKKIRKKPLKKKEKLAVQVGEEKRRERERREERERAAK